MSTLFYFEFSKTWNKNHKNHHHLPNLLAASQP